MVNFLTVQEPAFYKVARESGAVAKLIEERGTVIGYIPYQRLGQIAVITGLIATILWSCDLPEKITFTGLFSAFSVASTLAYCVFANEMERLRTLHSEIVSRTPSARIINWRSVT
jgi:hypothetical protein